MEAQDTSFSWWWPVRGSGDAGSGRNAVDELAHRPGLRTGEQVVEHPRDLGLVGVVQAFLVARVRAWRQVNSASGADTIGRCVQGTVTHPYLTHPA
jgi:hypothetical protein